MVNPDLPQTIPHDFDHAPATERLRRALYDAACKLAFTGSPGEEVVPEYSPDDCGFNVFHVWGRWFAVWYDLDRETTNSDLPPYRRWQVVRIKADSSRPEGISFQEV